MPLFRLFLVAACLAAFSVPAALAQDQSAAEPAKKVEIITDQEAGAVRIVIDGRGVATIDADGLHVAGNLSYTGTLTDTGGQAPEAGQHAE
jgi:phage baseplate assembly protein gpV